ncbi:hypothetical protein [uncultured Actinomyces sp.]|uniref:hypothetical protein n=1 Tax=uncultured Actinomyces sp. TaxID=249061 RepID=UPI00260EC174|nr:hypothetical protein [uncultured Actinomyces sp.]
MILVAVFASTDLHQPTGKHYANSFQPKCKDEHYFCALTVPPFKPSEITMEINQLDGLTMHLVETTWAPISSSSHPKAAKGNISDNPSKAKKGINKGTENKDGETPSTAVSPGATNDKEQNELPPELPTIERVAKSDFPAALLIDVPETKEEAAVVVCQKAGPSSQISMRLPTVIIGCCVQKFLALPPRPMVFG